VQLHLDVVELVPDAIDDVAKRSQAVKRTLGVAEFDHHDPLECVVRYTGRPELIDRHSNSTLAESIQGVSHLQEVLYLPSIEWAMRPHVEVTAVTSCTCLDHGLPPRVAVMLANAP
jgi:hypothetical protein